MSYFGNLTLNDPNLLTNSVIDLSSNSGLTGPGNYVFGPGAVGSYNTSYSIGSSRASIQDSNLKGTTLHVKGDAEFEGDLKINGRSIATVLNQIEQRLALLEPNIKLEAEWEELKALGDQYRKLEQHIKEKSKTWDILSQEE
jgi:hypothetical protein